MMDYNLQAHGNYKDSNLKSFVDSVSDLIDPFVYRELISSFMCLVNTSLDICFAVNTLR